MFFWIYYYINNIYSDEYFSVSASRYICVQPDISVKNSVTIGFAEESWLHILNSYDWIVGWQIEGTIDGCAWWNEFLLAIPS